jgi:hypothetical protein
VKEKWQGSKKKDSQRRKETNSKDNWAPNSQGKESENLSKEL